MAMDLTKPVFKADTPNKYPSTAPDPVWWLWRMLDTMEPSGLLGGIYANKPGFHNTGNANKARWPNNYSIRHKINQSGMGMTKGSALDWTFPDAQRGRYATIDKYTSRLVASSLDPNDPRLDMVLFEFYGQADSDSAVEGRNEYTEENVTSDSSHLWHIHMSFIRSRVNDYWGMWALFTVLAGWSVAKWRSSLPTAPPPVKPPVPVPTGVPRHINGAHQVKEGHRGSDVVFIQKWIGPKRMGVADGIAGPKFTAGVKWYQRMRGLAADGIVGNNTWRAMGVKPS